MKLRIGEYTACVMVDGVEQECYDVRTSDDGMTIECWIISEVGKQFAVNYTFAPFVVAAARLYIDGVFASGHSVNHPVSSTTLTSTLKEVRTSPTTAKPLQFSNIELTEDDQYLGNDATESNTLKLWFQHAIYSLPRYENAADFVGKKLPGSSKIHERTKKGLLAHGVGLGKETTIQQTTTYTPRIIGEIGTFIFRYTSRDILEARGIIQRQPSPERPVDNNADNDVLQAKVVKLEKRVKELQSQASSSSSSSSSSSKKVKRERGSISDDILDLTGPDPEPVQVKKKRKVVPVDDGEILDLTLD